MSVALQNQTAGAATGMPANTQVVPIKAGGTVSAFVPTTYDEAWRMSKGIVEGGFNPPSLKTPQAVMQAILYGLEVGMKPFMALKNIAIINGRPAIYGDALPGLVYASGLAEFIEVVYEGEGDNLVAICTTQRKGAPRPVTERFSVADAKKAGVWGKAGPWTQYGRRMLGIRARSFLLRDTYADILGGITVAEEVMDLPADEYQDITPPPATAEGEESAPAPAIARKPRAQRKASAPPAEVEEGAPGAANATAASDAPPAAEVVSEQAQADDGPPPAGETVEDAEATEIDVDRDPEEVLAEFRKALQADQTVDDVGRTYDTYERAIGGLPPGHKQAAGEAYTKRIEEIRGETQAERKARLQPAYDDGVASFYRGRKRTLGAPAAYKDGGELEKTWWKGYENADQGREPNPDAPPPAADETAPPASTSEPVDAQAAIDAAYEAGRQAHGKGVSKRGVPGEYRAPERQAESAAWLDGWNDAHAEG